MKKKVALLLASLMALSPVSAFAATTNRIDYTLTTLKENTLLMESTWQNGRSGVVTLNDAKNDDVDFAISGTNLVITAVGSEIKAGDTFTAKLQNAEWFFTTTDTKVVTPLATPTAATPMGPTEVTNMLKGTAVYPTVTPGANLPTFANEFAASFAALVSGTDVATEVNNNSNVYKRYSTDVADEIHTANTVNKAVFEKATFDRTFGTYTDTNTGAYVRYGTLAYEVDMYDPANAAPTYGFWGAPIAQNPIENAELPYVMKFNNSDPTIATITVLADSALNDDGTAYDEARRDFIKIPLVTRLTGAGDASVTIANSNTSAITGASYTFARLSDGGKTNASIKETIDAKYTFVLKDFQIAEDVIGTIKPGVIRLTAPYGYYFGDPTQPFRDEEGNDQKVTLSTSGGLLFKKGTSQVSMHENTASGPVKHAFINGTTEKNRIDITLDGTQGITLIPSTKVAGTIYLNNLVLYAEDYAPYDQDVVIKVSDPKTGDTTTGAKDSKVSSQDVKIGQRKDWVVTLTAASPVPTLVNGRFAGFEPTSVDDFDGWHKTSRVTFAENVVASWWEERETVFTLPEGVKFLQVELRDFDKDKEFDFSNKSYDDLNKTYNAYKLLGKREKAVTVSGNKLTLVDLSLQPGKKGEFKFDSWVSIESGFEGDVTLTVGGTAVPYEVAPVVIAKAVSPITIDTEVTDVKIGYQWQKVADFTINETGAGRLLRNKTMVLSIDDSISNDEIYFANDTVVEKAGNLSFSKPAVTKGQIQVTIDRESNGTAGAIKFSNVYVKIDRTVPESNNHPYKIIAEGPAIAANYHGLVEDRKSYKAYEALFSTRGIGADYLNVVTAATDKPGVLSNMVTVTIGSDVVLVGRNNPVEYQMDTAAYISADSDSTMIPVRFVAVALGIPEGQIQWDPEARTVTINYTNTTVQFKAGSDQITVNGITTTMYSPNVPPKKVVCEVKDNRTFLPFRQLGYALGVPVEYDGTTRSAIYNSDVSYTINTGDAE